MKRKLLTGMLSLVAALCVCFGLAACGGDGDTNDNNPEEGNIGPHEHIYTVENKCSVCGDEWEYTREGLEYTYVLLNGVEGYDVRFGEWSVTNGLIDHDTGIPIETVYGQPFEGEEVVFPYGYNGLPVISIGQQYPCSSDTVKRITVPKSIISFGKVEGTIRGALDCPALEALDLPDGLPVLSDEDLSVRDYSYFALPLCLNSLFYIPYNSVSVNCALLNDPQYRKNGALYVGSYLLDANFTEPVDTFTVKEGTKVIMQVTGAKNVVLPDSVEIIGDAAFTGDAVLERVTCGSGLKTIGSNAFSRSGLEEITLPDRPLHIGMYAFDQTPLAENQANWETESNSAAASSASYFYIGNHLIDSRGVNANGLAFTMKPELKSIAGDAFFGMSGRFSELRIPSIAAWLNVCRGNNSAIQAEKLIVDGKETTEIEIPSGVTTIENSAFAGLSSITRVIIPDSVTSIGNGAFVSCAGLTSIEIPDSVTSIGENAFYGCYGMENVTFGNGLTAIGRSAFSDCNGLTSVKIPDGVRSIDLGAFSSCYGLTSIEIPDSVILIGTNAFAYCEGLKKVVISDLEAWCNISFCIGLLPISAASNPLAYAHHLYLGEEEITNLTIPKEITEIKDCTFFGCEGLESVTMESGVTSIGNYAFEGCTGLESVTMESGVTSIGNYAFEGCSKLMNIELPDGVTSIGNYAFEGTAYYNDENKWDESGVLYIGNYLIDAKPTISGAYTVKSGTKTIAGYAFRGCGDLASIEIPDSVTLIGDYAFYGCTGLESVTMGSGVTEIGNYAFEGCSGLTGIVIPDSVTKIGTLAFYGCDELTSIFLPASVTSVAGSSFMYCNGLENFEVDENNQVYRSEGNCLIERKTNTLVLGCNGSVIPSGVTYIAAYAFYGCEGLTSVTIPESVTSIGNYAFKGCTGLTGITVAAGNPNYSSVDGILYNKGKTQFVCIPKALNGRVTIPDGVTEIGQLAFSDCRGLTSIIIPDSVTKIGQMAFNSCSRLTDIQFKGTVEEWQALEKENGWDGYMGDYTVTCTDGTVDKEGNATYFE